MPGVGASPLSHGRSFPPLRWQPADAGAFAPLRAAWPPLGCPPGGHSPNHVASWRPRPRQPLPAHCGGLAAATLPAARAPASGACSRHTVNRSFSCAGVSLLAGGLLFVFSLAWGPRRWHLGDPFLPCVVASPTPPRRPPSAARGCLSAAFPAATLQSAWFPGGGGFINRRRFIKGALLLPPYPPCDVLRRGGPPWSPCRPLTLSGGRFAALEGSVGAFLPYIGGLPAAPCRPPSGRA